MKTNLHPFLRIANWVLIAFFVLAVVIIAMSRPSGAVLGALNLLPFGSALIAVRQDTRRVGVWLAIGLNVIWLALLTFVVVMALLGQVAMPLVVFGFGIAMAIPCTLNALHLRGLLRGAG